MSEREPEDRSGESKAPEPSPEARAVPVEKDAKAASPNGGVTPPAAPAPTARRKRWRHALRVGIETVVIMGVLFALVGDRLVIAIGVRLLDHLFRKEIGHRLVVGELQLDLARTRVVGHDVMLFELGESAPDVRCEHVEIRFDLARLLRGEIVFASSELQGLHVRFERRAGGVAFVSAIARAQAVQPRKPEVPTPPPLVFEDVRIANATLTLVDEAARPRFEEELEITGRIRGMSFKKGSAPGDFSLRATGGRLARAIWVDGTADLDFDRFFARGDVAIEGADPTLLEGVFPELHSSTHSVAVSGEVGVSREKIGFAGSRVRFEVHGLALRSEDELEASLGRFAALWECEDRGDFDLRSLAFESPKLHFERASSGQFALAGMRLEEVSGNAPGAPVPDRKRATGLGAATKVLDELERALARGDSPESLPREAWTIGPATALPDIPFEKLSIEGASVRFAGDPGSRIPELGLADLDALLALPYRKGPRPLSLLFRARAPGIAREIAVDGQGTLGALALQGAIDIRASGIAPIALAPYLEARKERIALQEGELTGRLQATLAGGSEGTYRAEVALSHLVLSDRSEVLARIEGVDLGCALDLDHEPRVVAVSRLQAKEAYARLERRRGPIARVAFFEWHPHEASEAFSKEQEPVSEAPERAPAWRHLDVRIPSASLGVDLDVLDASGPSPVTTRLQGELELAGVRFGTPSRASFELDLAAEGIASDVHVEGAWFTSFATPGVAARLRAGGLESRFPRALLERAGWTAELEGREVEARVGFALAPQARGGVSGVARVSSLTVTDRKGIALALESAEVRAERFDPVTGVVSLPGVSVDGPRVEIDVESTGVAFGRFLRKLPPGPAFAAPGAESETEIGVGSLPRSLRDLRARSGRRRMTSVVESARITEGKLEIRERDGRTTHVDISAVAGPIESGPGSGGRPIEVSIEARVLHAIEELRVDGTISGTLERPRMLARVRASGVDLEWVRERVPEHISRALVRAGSLEGTVEASLERLHDGSLAADLAVRDVTFADDAGAELAGVTEARARVLRFDPAQGDLDLGEIDVEGPRLLASREATGEIVILGLASKEKLLPLSDEERRKREAREAAPPGEEEPSPKKPPEQAPRAPEAASVSAYARRLDIDRISIWGGTLRIVDDAARDEEGRPFVLALDAIEGSGGRFVLGAYPGPAPPGSFEVEGTVNGHARLAVVGTVARRPGGAIGHVDVELHGFQIAQISRYSENIAGTRFVSGKLRLNAHADFSGGAASGEVRIVVEKLSLKRVGVNPATGAARDLVDVITVAAITNASGETVVVIPFKTWRKKPVETGEVVPGVVRTALLQFFNQAFKLIVRPFEELTARPVPRWLIESFQGDAAPLAIPIERFAIFAPGDSRLTEQGARAVATAARFAKAADRQVSLRAECGAADRARAAREAALGREEVSALIARDDLLRRAKEDERRELASLGREALAAGEFARSEAIRARLLAVEIELARIEASLDELAERSDTESPDAARIRADESLRRLAAARVDTIRDALVALGVSAERVRLRPARTREQPGSDPRAPACVVLEVSAP